MSTLHIFVKSLDKIIKTLSLMFYGNIFLLCFAGPFYLLFQSKDGPFLLTASLILIIGYAIGLFAEYIKVKDLIEWVKK